MVIKKQQDQNQYTQQTKDTTQKQDTFNCRICFEQMVNDQVPNLCKCKPTQGSIHTKCLSLWIKSAVMQRDIPFNYYIPCNICHSKIYLQTQTKLNCIPFRRIQFFGNQTSCTLAMFIILLMGILMIGAGLSLIRNFQLCDLFEPLGYVALIIGCLISVIDLGVYIFTVMLQKQVVIKGIVGLDMKQLIKNSDNTQYKTQYNANDSIAKILQINITSDQFLQDVIGDE